MQSVARSLARYPVPYCRTMDHLHAWRFLLPKSIRETVIAFQPSHKDHEGTMYATVLEKRYIHVHCVYLQVCSVLTSSVTSYFLPRLFMYQHVPQLRYHNPDVKFVSDQTHSPEECSVTFHHGQNPLSH